MTNIADGLGLFSLTIVGNADEDRQGQNYQKFLTIFSEPSIVNNISVMPAKRMQHI
jgi:hypothetical protein